MSKFISDEEYDRMHAPKKGFISDEEYDRRNELKKVKKALEGPSKLESFTKGFAQGPTFGYAPKIQSKITGEPESKNAYDYFNAETTNPWSYAGGNLLGNMAAQAIPGIGIGSKTAILPALGKSAIQGGLQGSSQGSDYIAPGAGIGILGYLTSLGLGKALGSLTPQSLKDVAEQRAVKSVIGGGNEPAWKRIEGRTTANPGTVESAKKNVSKVGRDLLDEPGLIRHFESSKDIAPKVSKAKEKYGHQLGDIENNIDLFNPKGVVDSENVADDILKYASKLPENAKGRSIQDKMINEAADFSKVPMRGFAESKEWKNANKYVPNSPDLVISDQKASNAVRKSIGNSMEDAAYHQGVLDKYKNAKSKYSSFVKAAGGATAQQTKKWNNRLPSLTDYMVGTGAGTAAYGSSQNPITAVAAGILASFANKVSRERSSSTVALTADILSKTMERSPDFVKKFAPAIIDAIERGGPGFMVTHHLLLQNPEYRKEFEQSAKEEAK